MIIQLLVRLEGEQSDFASALIFYGRHYSGWTQAMALDGHNNFRVLSTKGTEYIKILEVCLRCTGLPFSFPQRGGTASK